jgi:hypothetical protein
MTLLSAVHPIYWHLPFLIVVVSLVYSATRFEQWGAIIREAFRWGLRMSLFLFGIMLILAGLSLDDYAFWIRVVLSVVGLVLEIALLFVK